MRAFIFFPVVAIFFLIVGCASIAATDDLVVYRLDPKQVWEDEPISGLLTRIPVLYAPSFRLPDLELTQVWWQPSASQVADGLVADGLVDNINADRDIWYVGTVYGVSPNQLWIHVSNDIDQVNEGDLSSYHDSGVVLDLSIGGQAYSPVVLSHADGDVNGVRLKFDEVDLVALWVGYSVDDMSPVLNSLVPLSVGDKLTSELDQHWSRQQSSFGP